MRKRKRGEGENKKEGRYDTMVCLFVCLLTLESGNED